MSALAVIDFDASGATTGYRLADPSEPQLRVQDLGATRGDGVFETISLGRGRPQALESHLLRFANSATLLELPPPDLGVWADAVAAVAAALRDQHGDAAPAEGYVKAVLSRGLEGGTAPTGWAFADAATDYGPARTDGIRIVLLGRGYRHDVAVSSPWLLAGAKTLSYAVNRAALREAARRHADDVLFVSSDGYLLEGPTSSLVLRVGRSLLTPRTDIGILAGTTQADVFRYAAEAGYATGSELLTPADLLRADAAWLVSSGRHAAPVRAVDGTERPVDAELSAAFNRFLGDRSS